MVPLKKTKSPDDLRAADGFLREQIPLTRAMEVHVVPHASGFAVEAPVAPNHNHLRTAFGGSVNAVATLAGYTFLWLELRDRAADLVLSESSIRFLRPVRETITAVCVPAVAGEMTSFHETFDQTGKARMAVRVQVEEHGEVAAEFRGTFVAIARRCCCRRGDCVSRAFVRESDDRPELPIARQASALPPGAKNYLTRDGAERLREELRRAVEEERPALAAASSDDADAKRRLFALDQKIQQLEQSLQSAEVVDPAAGAADVVRFGAFVTIRRANGDEDDYRIVGVDEIDLDRGWVSWASPIARALLNAKVGERVRFRFPSGEEQLEVVKISYEPAR